VAHMLAGWGVGAVASLSSWLFVTQSVAGDLVP